MGTSENHPTPPAVGSCDRGHVLPGEQALLASLHWCLMTSPSPRVTGDGEGDRVLPRPPSLTESGAASPAWLRPPP